MKKGPSLLWWFSFVFPMGFPYGLFNGRPGNADHWLWWSVGNRKRSWRCCRGRCCGFSTLCMVCFVLGVVFSCKNAVATSKCHFLRRTVTLQTSPHMFFWGFYGQGVLYIIWSHLISILLEDTIRYLQSEILMIDNPVFFAAILALDLVSQYGDQAVGRWMLSRGKPDHLLPWIHGRERPAKTSYATTCQRTSPHSNRQRHGVLALRAGCKSCHAHSVHADGWMTQMIYLFVLQWP